VAVKRVATALVVTSLFLDRIVDGLYQGLGRELPPALPLLGVVCMLSSLYAWFWFYSQSQRVPWPMDMGWLIFAAWMVVIPYYILKTEGRRGWGRIALFCFVYFAAFMAGWATLIWTQLLLR
jgi:hypothetical protein